VGDKPSWVNIAGGALLLFSAVLLGVGIHHLVATGTCSSTGYSANYGPVPHCPAGTGWWFAFVFAGIFGCLIGAFMAGNGGLIFAGIFGAIGFGALSLVLDSSARSSTKIFGAVFGGIFALVGVTAGVFVLGGALRSLRQSRRSGEVRYGKTKTTSRGSAAPPSSPTASMGVPSPAATMAPASSGPALTPLNLVPGLQAAKSSSTDHTLDELSKLAALHDSGGLTDEEFASAKTKLLGQM
jgi:hypothetical protein